MKFPNLSFFRSQTQPLSSVWFMRLLCVVSVVLALTAGYLYVSLKTQQRATQVWKRRFDACTKTTEAVQQLDDNVNTR